MDTVHRLLHPSADRRNRRRFASPHGEPPRRRAQSRPDAHGRGVQHRQPQAAGLDGRLAHPRRDLCPGTPTSGRPAAARAARSDVWQRFCVLVGGQFFRAGGFGRDASSINAHYGDQPGVKFYTHLSDRYAPFHTKVIAATASEAAYVLDGLLYHQSEVVARRHHTDGGGDSDHVFALCSLLGFQFAPRIPDLKSRRLYTFGKASTYPSLEPLIAGRINVALIRAHWSEMLRVAASIRTGTVTASLILRQLASYPRQNGLAAALRELGRLERTLFTLDWLGDAELRRQTSRELNKGETRNSLARAVFIHRLGQIRDRTYENQQHRASGLNLLVTAIILWNTRYLNRAIAALREVEDVPDRLLVHLSPLGWEHVNLTGDYIWASADQLAENRDRFRPLRVAPDTRKAA